jgi:TfoX/Sxy family transcriptional regulator of competence genes
MAYDVELADRLRDLVAGEPGITEKRMFGGLAFLCDGNMAVSASSRGGLLLRCDPDETDALLARPHAAPFEMRGRSMRGWLAVDAAGCTTDEDLRRWVDIGLRYASSLPPK